MELIDRDALKKRMLSYYDCVNPKTAKENYRGETLMSYEVADMIEDCIDNAPVVDAKPVVHGEWIWDDKLGRWYCSNCDNSPDFGFDFDNPGWMPGMDFCPNCGADNRGVNDADRYD